MIHLSSSFDDYERNAYEIRNLLFPPTSTAPELIKITYRVNFFQPICLLKPMLTNNTQSQFHTFYWTTIGLYKYIEPAFLNQLQPQLPFLIMRINRLFDNIPFLWDGCNSLPNLTLDLYVPLDSFTCVPALAEVNKILKMLTSHHVRLTSISHV